MIRGCRWICFKEPNILNCISLEKDPISQGTPSIICIKCSRPNHLSFFAFEVSRHTEFVSNYHPDKESQGVGAEREASTSRMQLTQEMYITLQFMISLFNFHTCLLQFIPFSLLPPVLRFNKHSSQKLE